MCTSEEIQKRINNLERPTLLPNEVKESPVEFYESSYPSEEEIEKALKEQEENK